MPDSTTSHLGPILHALGDNLGVIGAVLGGSASVLIWSWKQYSARFATVKAVQEAKQQNLEQHAALREHMDAKIDHVYDAVNDLRSKFIQHLERNQR